MPSVYQGVQCRSEGEPVLYLGDPQGITRGIRRRSLDSLDRLNQQIATDVGDPETVTRIAQYEKAYRMQMSATDAFDLKQENAATHQLYGTQPGKESFANNLKEGVLAQGASITGPCPLERCQTMLHPRRCS